MTDNEIMDILQKQLDYILKIYPEEKILGITTCGKASYGFAESPQDIETIVYYVPNFEDLCTKFEFYEDKIKILDDYTISIVDIRLLFFYIQNQNKDTVDGFVSKYKIYNKKYNELFTKYFDINKNEWFYFDTNKLRYFFKDTYLKDFKQNILEFMKTNLALGNDQKEDFLNNLTTTEKKAFNIIINMLDFNEGYFSLVQLTSLYNISRPVFKNVFDKMVKYNIAEVSNCGVKGTFVKIINTNILNN